jgi:bile acid:Na+ symporter, BASS family
VNPFSSPRLVRSLRGSLLMWLLLSCAAAFFWPSAWVDPFRLDSASLWRLITLTMFILGTLVRETELQELRRRPLAVLAGVLLQCTAMPAAALATVALLGLEGDLRLGVILVGCVPGAMASNVLTHAARGNVSYSISLTAMATLLSPLTVPLLLGLLVGLQDAGSRIDGTQVALSLLRHVILPVVAGYLIVRYFVPGRRMAERFGPLIAGGAICWIIASVVAGNRQTLGSLAPALVLGLLLINLLGYLAGYLGGAAGGFPESMRRALTLEVGMQNAGLGTALAAGLLGDATTATIPTAAYTFGCMLTGTLLARWWARAPQCEVWSDKR